VKQFACEGAPLIGVYVDEWGFTTEPLPAAFIDSSRSLGERTRPGRAMSHVFLF